MQIYDFIQNYCQNKYFENLEIVFATTVLLSLHEYNKKHESIMHFVERKRNYKMKMSRNTLYIY